MVTNKTPAAIDEYDAVPEYIIAQALTGDHEPLLRLLRHGNRHLTPGERAVAASIIAGELPKRGAGRPRAKQTPTAELQRWAVAMVLKDEGFKPGAQKWRSGEILGCSDTTITNAVKAVEARDPDGAERIARRFALQWARDFVDKKLKG